MCVSCFRVLPRSAEAQVIWGGIVKRLLVAYFIGNISATKYQHPFMCVKVIASQRWDVFWDTVTRTAPISLTFSDLARHFRGLKHFLNLLTRKCSTYELVCDYIRSRKRKLSKQEFQLWRRNWRTSQGQGSHARYKSGNVSETMQDKHIVAIQH